jgi:hypothetical protein
MATQSRIKVVCLPISHTNKEQAALLTCQR